jgi:hypothetical protein
MNEPIIETCDLHHKYYKEAGSDTRCPHCLTIGLQAARAENERLIDEAHLEVRATYDSTVAQAWREKLTASEAERIHARQILVEICNVVGACTADVSLTFLAHLPGEVKARIEKEHQTAVDLFNVVAEIAALMGIERSEPEICREVVMAVKKMKRREEHTIRTVQLWLEDLNDDFQIQLTFDELKIMEGYLLREYGLQVKS